MERLLLRYMYKREELYQLLFTYALVLIFSDACKYHLGHATAFGLPAAVASGQLRLLRACAFPTTTSSSSLSGR